MTALLNGLLSFFFSRLLVAAHRLAAGIRAMQEIVKEVTWAILRWFDDVCFILFFFFVWVLCFLLLWEDVDDGVRVVQRVWGRSS